MWPQAVSSTACAWNHCADVVMQGRFCRRCENSASPSPGPFLPLECECRELLPTGVKMGTQ